MQQREARSINFPETEASVRGPRQAFVESIKTNISLLRGIIKNTDLVFEKFLLGKQTKTLVYIAYMEVTAEKRIIEEIKKRLNMINKDLILDSSYIEQLIKGNKPSPFPTAGYTERPDKAAAKILEGKIAIFCDGSPFILTIPYTFIECFHNVEDYYIPPFFASFSRLLRILTFWISLLVPPLYVALATFHQEMIPTVLLITATSSGRGFLFLLLLKLQCLDFTVLKQVF